MLATQAERSPWPAAPRGRGGGVGPADAVASVATDYSADRAAVLAVLWTLPTRDVSAMTAPVSRGSP
jgi:hypothetical protein